MGGVDRSDVLFNCSTVVILSSYCYCNYVPDLSVNVYGIYPKTYSCLLAFVRYLFKNKSHFGLSKT